MLNIFWDNSNIWLVGRNVCEIREPDSMFDFRIHFAHLFDLVRQNRQINYAFVAGSIPPANDALWNRFNQLNISLEKYERGQFSGSEVLIDEIIQLKITERLLDAEKPETLVLLTGDGAGYNEGKGFIKQLERAVKKGWQVEVYSWDAGCNRNLKTFAESFGKYIPLEDYYENITFINNYRWAKKLI